MVYTCIIHFDRFNSTSKKVPSNSDLLQILHYRLLFVQSTSIDYYGGLLVNQTIVVYTTSGYFYVKYLKDLVLSPMKK